VQNLHVQRQAHLLVLDWTLEARAQPGVQGVEDTMTRTFNDDEAQRRDALYQSLQPRGAFEAAIEADKVMAECKRLGGLSGIARLKRKDRDAALLPLAIRALTARQRAT
jgi:hypothetical protein